MLSSERLYKVNMLLNFKTARFSDTKRKCRFGFTFVPFYELSFRCILSLLSFLVCLPVSID